VKDSVLTEIKDYLFSKTTSSIYDKGEGIDVTFTFKHVMCKASFSFVHNNSLAEQETAGSSTSFFETYTMNAIDKGSFNVVTGVAIADETKEPTNIEVKKDNSVFFFPQNSEIYVSIEHKGNQYKGTLVGYNYDGEDGLKYKSGKSYTFQNYYVGTIHGYDRITDKIYANIYDYVLDDGTIRKYDGTLNLFEQDRIVGWVFWTENDKSEDCDISLTSDPALMRHYPQCTHGLIICKKRLKRDYYVTLAFDNGRYWTPTVDGGSSAYSSSQMTWQGRSAGEILYDSYINSNDYEDEFEYIDKQYREKNNPYKTAGLYESLSNYNGTIGYNNTEILKEYNKSAKNYVRPVKVLTDAIEDGTIKNIPGCSSWYIPSIRELQLIWGVDATVSVDEEINYPRQYINSYFSTCDLYGSAVKYWSSTEVDENNALCMYITNDEKIKVLVNKKNDGVDDDRLGASDIYGNNVILICAF
jgi:hypothetical protein